MSKESYESRKPYAKEKIPSMKRRMDSHDYSSRQMYLITIVTEGRRPLLGHVEGFAEAPNDSPNAPRLIPSPLGEAVSRCWWDISRFYPQVKVEGIQLMPDHLHGILFVQEKMDVPLGKAIIGFKTGCNKAYRQLLAPPPSEASPQPPLEASHAVPYVAAMQRPTEQQQTQQRPTEQQQTKRQGFLFEKGYNDRLLLRAGQFERWMAYLRDNPRRLLMKREHPDLFRLQQELHAGGCTFKAIGNRFLLDWPVKLQVQCSRSLTEEQIETTKAHFLLQARQGAVLVSPSISPGEKSIMRAAVEAGLPVITLVENGLTPYTKPTGRSMETCAAGKLLILAPWEHHNEHITISREQCLQLNDMARAICEERTQGPCSSL